MENNIIEGYMPFHEFTTYYRIVKGGNKPALVLLHGGPGSTHNYMEVFDELAKETGRDIIMYDQLGCGNSYLENRPDLWKAETWVEELRSLRTYLKLKDIHLLGQSWGGMLAIHYMIEEKPEGVHSLILSSTLPCSELWGKEQHRLITFMSEEDQQAIREAEKTDDYTGDAYMRANEHFMKLHCADVTDQDPECVRRKKRSGRESYVTAWGPNEFTPLGTLKNFDYTERLHEIKVPALICSGTNDLCTPLIAKTMYDRIPVSKWHLFDGSRHMCFVERHEEYMQELIPWMEKYD